MPAPSVEGRALRATRIGASEVAAIVEPGSHPFTSAADVYARLVHGVERSVTGSRVQLGVDLESYVASRWRELTGRKVLRAWRSYTYRDLPLLATPDYLVPHDALLEVKVARGGYSDDFADLPRSWYWQLVAQLACTDRAVGYVAALIGSELKTWTIERDLAAEVELLNAVDRFDRLHLTPRIPPEPVPDDLLLVLRPRGAGTEDAQGRIASIGDRMAELTRRAKVAQGELDELRIELQRYMTDRRLSLLAGDGWTAEISERAGKATLTYRTAKGIIP
jgi:hypothetical protein